MHSAMKATETVTYNASFFDLMYCTHYHKCPCPDCVLQVELGIGPFGHRKALLDAVSTLSRQAQDAGPDLQPYPSQQGLCGRSFCFNGGFNKLSSKVHSD